MKIKLKYIAALFIVTAVVASCTKNAATLPDSPLMTPSGNFIGTFSLIHLNTKKNTLDTSHAVVSLALPPGGTFTIGGDTTKIQAASYGTFTADGTYMTFSDATVNKKTSVNAPKKHLNGPYLYTYDGTSLHIYGAADTLAYDYVLKTY